MHIQHTDLLLNKKCLMPDKRGRSYDGPIVAAYTSQISKVLSLWAMAIYQVV